MVNIEQAAITALKDFLQAQFDAHEDFTPDTDAQVIVRDEWPAAGDKLPPRCITILAAGMRRDTHLTEEVVKRVDKANNQGEFTWSIKAITQPLQLDVWAQYDSHRKQITAALDRFLNMGPLYTLGYGSITRDGPLLKLDPESGHEGFLDFAFDGPRPIDGEATAAEYQFRSLISGTVDAELTFTATTAKVALIKLKMSLGSTEKTPTNFTLQKVGDAVALAPAP